jgi:hypothetical protein
VVAARGDGHVVAAALLLVASVLLLGLGRVRLLATDDPEAVRGIAGSLVPELFAFLSIVLAINQLVLSGEYGSAAAIRSRLRKIPAFGRTWRTRRRPRRVPSGRRRSSRGSSTASAIGRPRSR